MSQSFTDVPSVKGFYEFIAVKQAGWWRQQKGEKVKGMESFPYPYTKDPIIAGHHILNCFRELDAETIFLKKRMQEILEFPETHHSNLLKLGHGDFKGWIVLYTSLTFRMIGRISTFENFSKHLNYLNKPIVNLANDFPAPAIIPDWIKFLEGEFTRGVKVFTGAHQTNGLSRYIECQKALEKYLAFYWQGITQCKSLQQVHNFLRSEIPGVSGFFAWQTCADLLEAKVIPYSENDWVYLGPGPTRSATMMRQKNTAQTDGLVWLCKVYAKQEEYLLLASEPFEPPPGISELTLKNLEHSLCEYSRYIGFQWGSLGT